MQNLKSLKQDKKRKFTRRKFRVNTLIKSTHPDFRIIVNKTNKYIKAQVLDSQGKVLAQIIDKGMKGATKVQRAEMAGETLAISLKEKGILKAAYDRNGHLYHGRVKAFAEGLRKGGIQI